MSFLKMVRGHITGDAKVTNYGGSLSKNPTRVGLENK